jgi:Na+/phosphate symporter
MVGMRAAYHEALEQARLDVVRLGALVGDALHASVVSLEKRDTTLAARVIAGDDDVDGLRRRVEQTCIELIWKQQPVAGELRQIAAMLEIVTDLERVGDYAVEIAKNSIKLHDVAIRPARVEIGRIAAIASEMLREVDARLYRARRRGRRSRDRARRRGRRTSTPAASMRSRTRCRQIPGRCAPGRSCSSCWRTSSARAIGRKMSPGTRRRCSERPDSRFT